MMPFAVMKSDGSADFESVEGFRHVYENFLKQGGLLARPAREFRAFEESDLSLVLPGGAKLKVRVQVTSSLGGLILFRIVNFDDAMREALRLTYEFTASAAPPPSPAPESAPPPVVVAPAAPSPKVASPSPTPPPPAPSAAPIAPYGGGAPTVPVPRNGDFVNPASPQLFLEMPLSRPPTPEQAAKPPMPLLLFWIAARKSAELCLKVKTKTNRACEVFITFGDRLHSLIPQETVLRTLSEPAGTFEVFPMEPPATRFSFNFGAIQFGVLKELLRLYTDADLEAAMSARQMMAPRLNGQGKRLLSYLPFSDAQQRLGQRMTREDQALADIIQSGVGVRGAWQVIYLLEVVGGLAWKEAPPRTDLVHEELRATFDRVKKQDHFSVLGLHMTSSAASATRALQRLRGMYGPGSPASQSHPELAQGIWSLLERSHAVISNTEKRKAYRKEQFKHINFIYAADHVKSQAQLAEVRGELELAEELMATALELAPSGELLAECKRLAAVREQSKPRK